MLTDRSKTYQAVMLLGCETDTQDTTGTILAEDREGALSLTGEQVRDAVMGFRGDYAQIPPMYSALKVDGKKLYELARAGKEVERQPRPVQDSGHKGKQDRSAQGLDGGHLLQGDIHTYPVP